MITVLEAARRSGRDPETLRRWIRSGGLRAVKVGNRHLIDEADLEDVVAPLQGIALPRSWRRTRDGHAMPDVVRLVREIRDTG